MTLYHGNIAQICQKIQISRPSAIASRTVHPNHNHGNIASEPFFFKFWQKLSHCQKIVRIYLPLYDRNIEKA